MAGEDLGGRRRTFIASRIRSARRLIEGGEPVTQPALDLGISRGALCRRIRELATPAAGTHSGLAMTSAPGAGPRA